MRKVQPLYDAKTSITLGNPGVHVVLRLEDIDQDGDADVVLYLDGQRVYSVQASTLWANVRNWFRRTVKRIRKAVRK